MAEEVEEEPKKSNLLKIIIFVVGGILLIAVGLGIGYFLFGGEPEPDPSAEVNQIIEGKETEKKKTEDSESKEGEEEGEDGIIKIISVDTENDLTPVLCAAIAPTRPHMYIFSFQG